MTKKSTDTPMTDNPSPLTDEARMCQTDVSRQDIEKAAYYRWEKRGCPIGDDQQDWYAAEDELNKTAQEEQAD